MTFQLINIPYVKNDIFEITSYYKEISPKLASEFIYRIREAQKHILLTPYGFEIKYKEVRTIQLNQFPYHIHYLINEELKQIIVLAVSHTYKNPKDYSNRNK